MAGHSLFAGCLLEAVKGGMYRQTGKLSATGTHLGVYVQEQVRRINEKDLYARAFASEHPTRSEPTSPGP